MKKKILYIFSLLLCVAFVLSGCNSTDAVQFVATTESAYDFYINNMVEMFNFTSENVVKTNVTGTDMTKIESVVSASKVGAIEEVAIMASIECFNNTSTPKVQVCEYEGNLIQVEYSQTSRAYNVTMNIGNAVLNYSFNVTKEADGSYVVRKNVQAGENSCTATVVFNTAYSNLSIDLTTKNSSGVTVKTNKEVITLKNGYMAFRNSVIEGDTNNRSYYTVECYKEIFNAKMKVAKSKADVGNINKQSLSKATFAESDENDITGYKLDVDLSAKTNTATTFGDLAQWILA